MAKSKRINPFCACGCGARTKGGTFRMGHDQRLRGILRRGERVNAVTRAFITSEGKRSEWARIKAAPSKPKARKPKARKAARRVARRRHVPAPRPQLVAATAAE